MKRLLEHVVEFQFRTFKTTHNEKSIFQDNLSLIQTKCRMLLTITKGRKYESFERVQAILKIKMRKLWTQLETNISLEKVD